MDDAPDAATHAGSVAVRAAIAAARELVAGHAPSRSDARFALLAAGADHVVVEVDDDLLVRVVRDDDATTRAARVEREERLLRAVAGISPVAVPVPLFTAPAAGAIAYRRLPGVPMLSLSATARREGALDVAARLGEVLAALHAAPVRVMETLAGIEEPAPAALREEASAILVRVADAMPDGARRAARRFVEEAVPLPAFAGLTLRFTHNDLGIEHVLVRASGARVLGIIDWSDAAVTDPATDFARILRDLGLGALEAALTAYAAAGGPESVRRWPALDVRVRFHARCLVLEDLAFGLETDAPAYVAKALDALHWLFPG